MCKLFDSWLKINNIGMIYRFQSMCASPVHVYVQQTGYQTQPKP